jgi:dynein heavy chain
MVFVFRETENKILTSVETIQVHLDDHLMKTQTMRGSPYFKAFEGNQKEFV